MVHRVLCKSLSIPLCGVTSDLTDPFIHRHLGVFQFSPLKNSAAVDFLVVVYSWAGGHEEATSLRLSVPSRQAGLPPSCACLFTCVLLAGGA